MYETTAQSPRPFPFTKEEPLDGTVDLVAIVPATAGEWVGVLASDRAVPSHHLLALLAICREVLPPDCSQRVYRTFKVYAAGIAGVPCHTGNQNALDYWYQRGRAFSRDNAGE